MSVTMLDRRSRDLISGDPFTRHQGGTREGFFVPEGRESHRAYLKNGRDRPPGGPANETTMNPRMNCLKIGPWLVARLSFSRTARRSVPASPFRGPPGDRSLPLRVFQTGSEECCQGIRGKSGQTTVAPIKAWRGSPAGPPRPLTARLAKPRPPPGATPNLLPGRSGWRTGRRVLAARSA